MTRGVKTRNGGRWTEAYFWGQFRNMLRKMSMYWRTFDDYLLTIRVDVRATWGNVNTYGKCKYVYPCDGCKIFFPRKEIQGDHKIPCGSLRCEEDLLPFFKRTFIEQDGWQALCHECHANKTSKERSDRKGFV